MIALGNNEYRTLDQKIYIGNQQVGKVYLGETLIYPEEKIVIGGIDIDTEYHSLDGNMFDLGYAPSKDTRFECCFIPNSINDNMALFGTQHDNKCTPAYTYTLTGDNLDTKSTSPIGGYTGYSPYDVKVLNNSQYTTIEKGSTDWTNNYVGTNGYANYKNQTKFSLIKGSNIFSFRYGGEQDAGSTAENNITVSMVAKQPYVLGFDDYNNTKLWYCAAGKKGRYYYIINNEPIPADIRYLLEDGNTLHASSIYSDLSTGGNIWLNAINARISNPNVKRPYDSVNHTFDGDLIYYSDTSNMGFVYMIIWEVSGPKTLYTQNYDENRAGSKVLINKYVQVSDGQGGYKFRDPDPNTGKVPVDEIIYPFYRCKPV